MRLVQIIAAVLVGYVLLRLTGRVRRLELVTGAWRTQVDGITWYETDEYVEALAEWSRELGEDAA